jgi:ribosomal protein L7/L12
LLLACAAFVVVLRALARRGERSYPLPAGGGTAEPGGSRSDVGDIEDLLRAGQKIAAIKAYRATHRVDLTTAKQAIDALERQLRAS